MEPVETPAHSGQTPPGWFPDPWQVAAWRWWDGMMWTGHVSDGAVERGRVAERQPRLPGWLSPPVAWSALPVFATTGVIALMSPASVLLSLVPLVIVVPTLWWLDRVEPEPHSSLVHSLLWGATVAVLISSIVNTIVAVSAGTDVAAVASAPIIEEATKGLGIWWALRRHEIDSVVDGVIYAGWVAIGFAVVEDVQYFFTAAGEDQLIAVFIVRGLVTPFAHPLFTFWIGLAVGLAVERRERLPLAAWWGYLLSVATHAAWNGSLVASESSGSGAVIVVAALGFVILFFSVVISLVRIRQRERSQFVAFAPMLVQRYGLTPAELDVFSDWGRMLRARRSLSRPQRRAFDGVHAALARLAVLHARPGEVDAVDEARLVNLLHEARAAGGALR